MSTTGNKPPKPTYTLTLSIGSCEWDLLIHRLREEVEHIAAHGWTCRACWGGAGTHGQVEIDHRPDVTSEAYEKELHEWWMAERVARDVREEVREVGGG